MSNWKKGCVCERSPRVRKAQLFFSGLSALLPASCHLLVSLQNYVCVMSGAQVSPYLESGDSISELET